MTRLQSIERELKVQERDRRRDVMLLMREQGATLAQIGKSFGLTKQRVAQIIGKVRRGRWTFPVSSRHEQE